MAKVKYLDGKTTQFGYEFVGGKAVEVPEGLTLSKFRGNRFFEVVDELSNSTPELVAKHKGRGVFSVFGSDGTLVEGMNKAEADAFNAMSDEDKAAYIKAQA